LGQREEIPRLHNIWLNYGSFYIFPRTTDNYPRTLPNKERKKKIFRKKKNVILMVSVISLGLIIGCAVIGLWSARGMKAAIPYKAINCVF